MGHIYKRAIPLIAIQYIGTKISHVEIRVCVPIIIPHHTPHAPSRIPHPGLLSNIHKRAIPLIAIQRIAQRIHRRTLLPPPINQINIQIPIAIVIEKRRTPSFGLNNITLHPLPRPMPKIQPRRLGPIDKNSSTPLLPLPTSHFLHNPPLFPTAITSNHSAQNHQHTQYMI